MSQRIVIAPEGELDLADMTDFRRELGDAAAEGEGFVVDLSHVSFIDSTGLGALVDLHRRLQRNRRELSVVAPGGTAAALLLNLSGLRGRVPVYETRQAALEH